MALVWMLHSSAAVGIVAQPLGFGMTPGDLVTALLGPGVTVGTVSYTGATSAAGAFTGGADSVGFDSGIILSSGSVASIAGPNDSDGTTTVHGTPGDADLNTLISGFTFDASVLEFSFVPDGPEVTFRYVFASEEYNEYVGSFNDVFGFFINGLNYALLPDAVTVVSINNINNAANPSFYIDNDCSDTPCALDIEADGLTVVLTLTAPVTPDMSNTIKLAVADASDSSLDSWVLIEAGSFTLGENCENGVDDDGDGLVDSDDPDCHVCGDGDLDPGEQCDDGNVADGDGCSALCMNENPECGDGIVDSGEDCDDGNTIDGDCCSANCTFEVGACDDGNACTADDLCDGAGSCIGGDTVSCDDGEACTQDSCDPASGCSNEAVPLPPITCRAAGKSMLLLKAGADDGKDKLIFKWLRGAVTTTAELGNPSSTTDYTLCLYSGGSVAALDIAAGESWKTLGSKGFKYKDNTGESDGAQGVLLKSGDAGRAKATVKGKGRNLPDELTPPLELSVIAQLVNGDNATCFEAVFEADDVIRNDEKQFKAKR